ncbi:MAG: two-component system sensor histidine kinase NtrB [Nitrospirota bacterium]
MWPRFRVVRSLVSLTVFCVLMLTALGLRRHLFPHPVAEQIVSAVDLAIVVGMSTIGVAAVMFRLQRRSTATPGSEERAGFVMHTFQEVLRQLKEKEAELEQLRARAVARAEDVESYHGNILRSIASGVITCDPAGRITTFNAAAERILGFDAEHVLGRPCQDVFGGDTPIPAMVRGSLETLAPISRREWEFRRCDRDRVWVGLSSALLRDRNDQPIGAALVFTDLSEIKRLEERVESERRLAVLGEMSAWIAHEFRNYMGTIVGWTKMLGKQTQQDSQAGSMVDAIKRELGMMQRLIDDLLAFGRRMEPHVERVAFRELVSEGVCVDPGRGDVNLEVSWAVGVPDETEWDPTLMRQVLKNLTHNAVDAMPEGGVLRVAIARSQGAADAVELVISDTGSGIPAEHVGHIFDPFFTLKAGGHGLGLALVQKIVSAHGGQITVQSAEGRGTTFRLTLPVSCRHDPTRTAWLSRAA